MRIMVLGCGRVGSGLAYRLEVDRHDVTVVDHDPGAISRLGPGFAGRAIIGDALDRSILEDGGIGTADALAAVTGSDEVNAVLARLASTRFRVPRVVARMYEPHQAHLYGRLGALTISPVEWGVTRLANLLTQSELADVAAIGGGNVLVVEVTVTPGLAGRNADELRIPGETRLISVTRAGRTFIADGPVALETGDLVAIAVVRGAESRLEEMLGRE